MNTTFARNALAFSIFVIAVASIACAQGTRVITRQNNPDEWLGNCFSINACYKPNAQNYVPVPVKDGGMVLCDCTNLPPLGGAGCVDADNNGVCDQPTQG